MAGGASRRADENGRRNANAGFAFRLCCVGRLRQRGPLRGPVARVVSASFAVSAFKPSSFRVLRAFVFLVPFACFVIFLIELFFYGVTVRDVRPKGSSCLEDQDGV